MAETNLYNPNEGLVGRGEGIYLDRVEAERAEEIRAAREGREPNKDEYQPYVGTQLITEAELFSRGAAVNIPSKSEAIFEADSVKEILVDPVMTREIPASKESYFLAASKDAEDENTSNELGTDNSSVGVDDQSDVNTNEPTLFDNTNDLE